MSSTLSPDQIERLLPLLAHLAELIGEGEQVEARHLHFLLAANDLDEEWALSEMARWIYILTTARNAKTSLERKLAWRAFMLRGVPEATALLAVEAATRGTKPTKNGPQEKIHLALGASVTELNLGTLPAGQGATASFEVWGGPGRIVVESDQVEVTPATFGPERTEVQVRVRPLGAGMLLMTTLRLVTGGETLEIPVVAQGGSGAEVVRNEPKVPTESSLCPHCGQVNDVDEIYCQHCAHQLCDDGWCHHCQRAVPVKARYCPECGQKL